MIPQALARFILAACLAVDVSDASRSLVLHHHHLGGREPVAVASTAPVKAKAQAPSVRANATSVKAADVQGAPTADRFSAAAAATLQNISQQVAQFQKMVLSHSSRFEAVLQQQEKDNEAVQAASGRIEASNQKLQAHEKALELQAKTLLGSNRQLRSQLKGLEKKLRIAQEMAESVNSFKAAGDEQDENHSDHEDEVALKKTSLIVVSMKTALAKGVKDFMQEEALQVAGLQSTLEAALADGKKHYAQLIDQQRKFNATRVSLQGRISSVTSMVARLNAAHTRLAARVKNLGNLFQRLASIAGGQGGKKAAAEKLAGGQGGKKAEKPGKTKTAFLQTGEPQ